MTFCIIPYGVLIFSFLFFPPRFGKHGLAINLLDGPDSYKVMKDIEAHFGRPITKLDAENVDEIEQLQKD